jgi:nucleotide-binding universal stress UspA family protein
MFKRVVVPVDDSEGARKALDFAARWSQTRGGQLRLVHYLDVQAFPNAHGYGQPVIHLAQQAAESFLAQQKTQLEKTGLHVETSLCLATGKRLGESIAEDAAAWGADLIVLGSHGRKGLSRALLGSGAEQIIRHATVPTLMIPAGAAV